MGALLVAVPPPNGPAGAAVMGVCCPNPNAEAELLVATGCCCPNTLPPPNTDDVEVVAAGVEV